MAPKWTIAGRYKDSWLPRQEFETKREAVQAMEAIRKPKTAIVRQGRDYIFTAKDGD